jgi:hypothetical protein
VIGTIKKRESTDFLWLRQKVEKIDGGLGRLIWLEDVEIDLQ